MRSIQTHAGLIRNQIVLYSSQFSKVRKKKKGLIHLSLMRFLKGANLHYNDTVKSHFRIWKLLKTRQKKRYACLWRSSCEHMTYQNFRCKRLGTLHLSQLSTIISSRERYVKTFPKNAFSCVTIYYFRSNFAKKNSKLFSKVPKWRHRNFASKLSGCKKIVIFFINQKLLLKKLDFMKMWFWEKFSHIAL